MSFSSVAPSVAREVGTPRPPLRRAIYWEHAAGIAIDATPPVMGTRLTSFALIAGVVSMVEPAGATPNVGGDERARPSEHSTGDSTRGERAHESAVLDYSVAGELVGACPDRESFAAAVATRLGYDAFASPAAGEPGEVPRVLHVRIRRDRVVVTATLQMTRGEANVGEEKTLSSATGACDEVESAAAFAAAILVDPRSMFPKPAKRDDATMRVDGTLDSNSAGTWPWYKPRTEIPEPDRPAPPPPPPTPWRFMAGAAAAMCSSCAPTASFGGTIFGAVERGHVGLELGFRADGAVTQAVQMASGTRSVTASLVAAEIYPHLAWGPVQVGPLGLVGSLFGESDGERHVSPWTAAGVRGALVFPVIRPLFVRAAVDGAMVLSRVSLRVGGAEVWSSSPLLAQASVGAGVQF